MSVEDIVEVKIKKKEINLVVWLLPIVSLFIAGWLVYKYYSSLGPLVEIYFKNSGGLEPKKSFVRFRDVKVGVVEDVILLSNGVLVKVRMHKDIKPFLNNTTKFWIVTPTVEVGKIKGLEALITGPYIQMYAKDKGFQKTEFEGLNEPPLDSSILNGKIIKLFADDSYSLSEKMPVYYKSIKVGSIRRVKLLKDKVEIVVSIKKEYAKFVNDTTRFWNLRGIDISLDKDNLKVVMPGISQILIGGIEFDTLDLNKTLTKRHFCLYASRSDAYDNVLGRKKEYENVLLKVVNNKNSLIKVGNPLLFKGFKVGYVKYVSSYFDLKRNEIISLVYAKLDIGAFGGKENFEALLKKGLSAFIVTNPIFGDIKINLVINKPYLLKKFNGIWEIKVVNKNEIGIVDKLQKFIDKLNKLDFNVSLNNINKTVLNLNKTLNSANILINNSNKVINKIPDLIDNLNSLLRESKTTLKDISVLSNSYSKNSIFYLKINELLKEIHNSVNEFYKIEKKIDKKPNSLIFGE